MAESGVASVAVVVPVYNGGAAFRRCAQALVALSPPPAEWIVVGDGDEDGSSEFAESLGARVVRIAGPGGPARARNAGVRAAESEVVLFLDADVLAPPDTVARVQEVFAADPGLGACFGSYDDAPAEPNFLSQYKNLQHHFVHQRGREEASTFWAGCGAVRRAAFVDAGGFDEGYRAPCIEDIELGYRLREKGYRIRLVKDLQVKHLKRWEPASHLRAEIFGRALPWTELLLSRAGLVNDLNTDLSTRASVAAAWLLTGTLAAGAFAPGLLGAAPLWAAALLVLNRRFYGFLYRKRGGGFLARALFWHWLYFFYCGLAFVTGLLRHRLGAGRRRRRGGWGFAGGAADGG